MTDDPIDYLSATLEAVADALIAVDLYGKVIMYNRKFAELWRIPENIMSQRDNTKNVEFVLDQVKDRVKFLEAVHRMYEQPEVETHELIERVDGRTFERIARPLTLPRRGASSEKIIGVVVCYRDSTERLKAEENLRISMVRFKTLFERSPIGIGIMDVGTGSSGIYVNPAFTNMVGYTSDEIAKVGFQGVTHPDDVEAEAKLYAKIDSGEFETYTLEKRYIRSDGEVIWGSLVVYVGRDERGAPVSIIGMVVDITKRKKAERERDELLIKERSARLEAQKALALRDEFIAMASHELKTPITPLKLQVDMIKRQFRLGAPGIYPKAKETLKSLEGASQQLDRLSKLIENMLNVSLISAGKFEPNLERTDFSELLLSIIGRLAIEAEAEGYELTVHVSPGIRVKCDSFLVEQVVVNLVTNAIKYGQGKPIEIDLRLSEERGAVLRVTDHGIGISKSDQERIFDRFERAVSLRHFAGFGLGLYITRQIVLSHGGRIEVISEFGKGACFVVELPLA